MSQATALQAGHTPEWFESWFDTPYYRALYRGHDDGEAARFVDALIPRLAPERGAAMLDLGCGTGRHSRSLAARGYRVTGVDLSANSLREAKRFEGPMLRFHRRDMREPLGTGVFDYVFSFFTSFGYFEGRADHLRVVANIADALQPEGWLVLDYLNVRAAEDALVPFENREIDGVRYRLTRWTDVEHFYKRIVVEDPARRGPVEYVERVAKFWLDDFRAMLAPHGLEIAETWGNYALAPYDARRSPRLIVLARKVNRPAASARWRAAND